MTEKVYTYCGTGRYLICTIGGVFVFIWWVVAIADDRISGIFMSLSWISLLLAIFSFFNMFFYFNVPFIHHFSLRKIIIGKKGVILDRGLSSPIVIQKITNLEAKEELVLGNALMVALIVEGLTSDGKRIKKKFVDIGFLSEQMREFYNDLEKFFHHYRLL